MSIKLNFDCLFCYVPFMVRNYFQVILGGEDMDLDMELVKRILELAPEDEPTEDEIKAIKEAESDDTPAISHEQIDWN